MLKIWSFLAQHLFNSKKNRSISLSPFHNLKRREKQSIRLKSSQSKSRAVLAATCCETGESDFYWLSGFCELFFKYLDCFQWKTTVKRSQQLMRAHHDQDPSAYTTECIERRLHFCLATKVRLKVRSTTTPLLQQRVGGRGEAIRHSGQARRVKQQSLLLLGCC